MNSLGLQTGLDIRNQSLEFMQANFGKAVAYYWISRGADNREVRATRIRNRSVPRTRSPTISSTSKPWSLNYDP